MYDISGVFCVPIVITIRQCFLRSVSEPMGFGFYINNIDNGNDKIKANLTVLKLVFTGCNCTCKHLVDI